MTGNRILHIDFEAYSEADLRKTGVENWMRSPGFVVTVMAWAFDDGPVLTKTWPDTSIPETVRAHIRAGGEIRAHNALFEWNLLTGPYGIDIAPAQMCCTMQKALAYGLPADLLGAGRALGLAVVKDETKRPLMLQMSRPRKGNRPWHETDAAKLAELAAYCADDVRAERALDRAVPDLHPWEKQISELDMQINRRGVLIDRLAVKDLRMAATWALQGIDAECTQITQGWVERPGTQVARLMDWLEGQGLPLPNVTKETIAKALAQNGIKPAVRRVLELRQAAAKSSISKLDSMLAVASTNDSRARNLLQYYGAGRTGRWAGRLIQPQNLPRVPKGFDAEGVIRAVRLDLEAPGLLWGDQMDTISKCLRSCFVAKKDHHLVSLDLSQIEARVLAWLAGQQDVLDAFRRGEDVYVLAARKVGSTDRQLGKVLTLACGFGMGAQKFMETAAAAPYFIKLTLAEATAHLQAWRRANPFIVQYWYQVERCVAASVGAPGAVIDMSHGMAIRTQDGVTQIRKPSGVKLTYHNMRISPDGGLIFSGVNGKTKKWEEAQRTYGGRLVENITQSVARDVMAEGMLSHPDGLVMSVHDEIVWELPEHRQGMAWVHTGAAWTATLPITSEEHRGNRYAK